MTVWSIASISSLLPSGVTILTLLAAALVCFLDVFIRVEWFQIVDEILLTLALLVAFLEMEVVSEQVVVGKFG